MSDAIYRPLIEDMTWSWSRIELFDQCPYAWFVKYIRGEAEQPRFYTSYGSFMHKLIERYYSDKAPPGTLLLDFLTQFNKEVEGARPSEAIVSKYIDQGISYFKNLQPFQLNTVAVEKQFTSDIQGVPFTGIVDYIGEKDGDLYIVDHKSADLRPRSNRKKETQADKELSDKLRQLYIYSAFLQKEYGKLPKYLCFNCFRTGAFIKEPFSRTAYQEALDQVPASVGKIAGETEFSPKISFFFCKYLCGFSHDCCYWNLRGGN